MPRPHRGMKNVQIPFGICTYSSGSKKHRNNPMLLPVHLGGCWCLMSNGS